MTKPTGRPRGRPKKVATLATPSGHLLDSAPIHSRIVGTDQGTLYSRPDWKDVVKLRTDDPAGKLPVGAHVQKMAEGRFHATQLDPQIVYPDKDYPTALDAIVDFIPHFHPRT